MLTFQNLFISHVWIFKFYDVMVEMWALCWIFYSWQFDFANKFSFLPGVRFQIQALTCRTKPAELTFCMSNLLEVVMRNLVTANGQWRRNKWEIDCLKSTVIWLKKSSEHDHFQTKRKNHSKQTHVSHCWLYGAATYKLLQAHGNPTMATGHVTRWSPFTRNFAKPENLLEKDFWTGASSDFSTLN